jgi:hypothetical protein
MFALRKYYFDVVTQDGEYGIAYWDALQLPWLSATYSELSSSLLAKPSSQLQLLGAPSPLDRRSVNYVDVTKGLNAGWKEVRQAPRMSYANDVLRWELVQLRSQVTLRHHAAPLLSGLGYGERVSWLVPPWNLGIRKLWWGRYLSPRCFLMWIIAEGDAPIKYGIVDQSPYDEVTFVGNEIRVGDATLKIGKRKRVISEGDVLRGKSLSLRLMSALGLGRQPRILQRKATFKCLFCGADGVPESGYAVSEIVWFDP